MGPITIQRNLNVSCSGLHGIEGGWFSSPIVPLGRLCLLSFRSVKADHELSASLNPLTRILVAPWYGGVG